jgi:exonuclease SbcD
MVPKEELNIKANTTELISKYTRLAIKQLAKEVDISKPAVLAMHCSVDVAQWSSEREMSIGNNATVSVIDLVGEEKTWDYVALGHIHSYQDLTAGTGLTPVVYAGSIERVNHGEEKEDKGFVIVNIENGETTHEFISVNPRPYKTLEILCTEESPTERVISKIKKANLTDAVVRVLINIPEAAVPSLDVKSINDILNKSDMFCLSSLSVRPIRENAMRDTGEVVFSTSFTTQELLNNYLDYKEVDGDEKKKLLKMANSIIEEVENDEAERR